MGRFNYVIFDCDGVLVDSEILANKVEVAVKTELGFPITLEEQLRTFVGMGLSHPVMQAEIKRLPSHYLTLFDERVREAYLKELRLIAGTLETLETLPLPKCVASSSEPEWLEMKLSLTGLKKYFEGATFHGRLVSKSKPEPDLFLFALKHMGWKPGDCLVVEDSVHGVRAGIAAGLTVCGFLGGAHILPGHGDKLKEAGAHFLVNDLREIKF